MKWKNTERTSRGSHDGVSPWVSGPKHSKNSVLCSLSEGRQDATVTHCPLEVLQERTDRVFCKL